MYGVGDWLTCREGERSGPRGVRRGCGGHGAHQRGRVWVQRDWQERDEDAGEGEGREEVAERCGDGHEP